MTGVQTCALPIYLEFAGLVEWPPLENTIGNPGVEDTAEEYAEFELKSSSVSPATVQDLSDPRIFEQRTKRARPRPPKDLRADVSIDDKL